jgi:hypothetical protein
MEQERRPQILEWEVRLSDEEFAALEERVEQVIDDYLASLGLEPVN